MAWIIIYAFLLLGSIVYSDNHTQSIKIVSQRCQFFYSPPKVNISFMYCTTPSRDNQTLWGSCLDECCNDMPASAYSTPSYDTIIECQNAKVTISIDTIYLIILYSIGIICIIIFSCFLVILFKFIKRSCETNRQAQQSNKIQWEQEDNNISSNIQELIWIENHQIREREQTNCTICLQNKCSTQLFCKHLYHPHCITQWLQKSNFCPLCHRKNIRSAKIYCCHCQKDYFICKINFLSAHRYDLIQLKCKRCKQSKSQGAQLVPIDSILIFDISNQNIGQND